MGREICPARLRRLEDIEEITRLRSLYARALDQPDLALLGRLLTDDIHVAWGDGRIDVRGRAAVVAMFGARLARPSFHFTHDHHITFDDGTPDRARGIVMGHAEVMREDGPYIVATSYADRYRRAAGGWRFSERILRHLYFAPPQDYPAILTRPQRLKTAQGWVAAHWPRGEAPGP